MWSRVAFVLALTVCGCSGCTWLASPAPRQAARPRVVRRTNLTVTGAVAASSTRSLRMGGGCGPAPDGFSFVSNPMLLRGGPAVVRVSVGIAPRGVGLYAAAHRLSDGWTSVTVTVAANATTGAGYHLLATSGTVRIARMQDLGVSEHVAVVSGLVTANLRGGNPARRVHVTGAFACEIDALDNAAP